MKKISNLLVGLSLLATTAFSADSQMEVPSAVPINVFEMDENQIGVGYIQFGATLELEDDYYNDKIGDADFKSKGLILTLPKNQATPIGKMFELSYTVGTIDSSLKNNQFQDSGKNYTNSYEKDGFYVGVRPAFSTELYKSDMFTVQNSTSLHLMLYSISGSFSVSHDGGGANSSYKYDETNTGIGLKPTTVINGTYFPMKNLGLSVFGGLSTFIALDYCSYSGDVGYEDDDVELNFQMASIDPIYGFDVVLKGIFGENDTINLSSVFASKSADTSVETIVRYVFTF